MDIGITLTGEVNPLLTFLVIFLFGLVVGEAGAFAYANHYIKQQLRGKVVVELIQDNSTK